MKADDERDGIGRRRWRAPVETERECVGADCDERAPAARAVDQTGVEGVALVSPEHVEQVNGARIAAREGRGDFGGLEEDQVHELRRAGADCGSTARRCSVQAPSSWR